MRAAHGGIASLRPRDGAAGGIAALAPLLAAHGRNGDTMLAHLSSPAQHALRAAGGSGRRNPDTGLRAFDDGGSGASAGDGAGGGHGGGGGVSGGSSAGSGGGTGGGQGDGVGSPGSGGPDGADPGVGPSGPGVGHAGSANAATGVASSDTDGRDATYGGGWGMGSNTGLGSSAADIAGFADLGMNPDQSSINAMADVGMPSPTAQAGFDPIGFGIGLLATAALGPVAGMVAGLGYTAMTGQLTAETVASTIAGGLFGPVAGLTAGYVANGLDGKGWDMAGYVSGKAEGVANGISSVANGISDALGGNNGGRGSTGGSSGSGSGGTGGTGGGGSGHTGDGGTDFYSAVAAGEVGAPAAPPSPTSAPPTSAPASWSETAFLAANPDVAKAVQDGVWANGYEFNKAWRTFAGSDYGAPVDTAQNRNAYAYRDDFLSTRPGRQMAYRGYFPTFDNGSTHG